MQGVPIQEALGVFSEFHLVDLGQKTDKELEGHKVIGLMEQLLKYSRDQKLFKVLGEELRRLGDQLFGVGKEAHPLGTDYWQVILVYVLSVLDPSYASEEEVVNLFIEKLAKPGGEVRRTIFQQIATRIRPELKRTLSKEGRQEVREEGIQQGMQQGLEKTARNMLSSGLSVSLISQVTGLSKQAIAKLS